MSNSKIVSEITSQRIVSNDFSALKIQMNSFHEIYNAAAKNQFKYIRKTNLKLNVCIFLKEKKNTVILF